jgi:hypothetical protein
MSSLWEAQALTKRVTVPIEGATNVTLFGEHYDVEDDGTIEVPNSIAKRVLAEPDLQHAAANGKRWTIVESADVKVVDPVADLRNKQLAEQKTKEEE